MDELYSNLFVQYLYKECSEKQTSQVEELLQTDNNANELYTQLQEAQVLLENCFLLQHPHKKSIRRILEYANK